MIICVQTGTIAPWAGRLMLKEVIINCNHLAPEMHKITILSWINEYLETINKKRIRFFKSAKGLFSYYF